LRHSFCSKGPTPSLSVGCLPGAPSFHRLIDPIDALLSFIVVPATDSFVLFLVDPATDLYCSSASSKLKPASSIQSTGSSFFTRCRPSDRFFCCCGLFIDEVFVFLFNVVPATASSFLLLSTQRQIHLLIVVDPINTVLLHTASFQAQAVFIDPIDGFFSYSLTRSSLGDPAHSHGSFVFFFFINSHRSNRRPSFVNFTCRPSDSSSC